MSIATERPLAEATVSCDRCGAWLAADQEWCLECGSARTLIHSPPSWRAPVAIVGAVALVALAALVVVLIRLSADANRLAAEQSARPASSPSAQPITRTAASAPAPPPAPSPSIAAGAAAGQIASWPVGLGGWTVVLFASSERALAHGTARHIASSGTPVGLLYSSQHPSLTPGLWVVFSGRYPTATAATTAALKLQRAGYPSAHIRLVGPPGGA